MLGTLITLRDKRIEDAGTDYAWRINDELSALDATTPMRLSYNTYLRMFEDELLHTVPWSKRFGVDTHDGRYIGNAMYYDIDTAKGQAELGIMIGDKSYWNQGYGTDTVNTLIRHIFTTTTLNRVYLHTLTWNIRAQKSFEKSGFTKLRQVKRSGYDFILMELFKDKWSTLVENTGLTTE